MILNGNQRGGAKDLAIHLMKPENERIEIHELRGFMSDTLMGALNEIYAISRATQCKQFMYSLSLNPPPNETVSNEDFEQAIDDAEKRLGLGGQARAVVFHEKDGRRHCHVVWSRIDLETMTARQMSHDHEKLTNLSRELFRRHGWEMPDGFKNRKDRDPLNYTHAEYQQAKRVGKNARDIKSDIQAAWALSDNRASLEHALAERGYFLARGDKGRFVVVDLYGEIYSLPKQLPKGINTKEVREKIGDEDHLRPLSEILEQLNQRYKNKTERLAYNPKKALKAVTYHHAAFTSAIMDRALKRSIPSEHQRKLIIDEILQSGDVVKIGERKGAEIYATQEMITLEKRMAETAQAMAQNKTHAVDQHGVHRAIYSLNTKLANLTGGKAFLSEEQTNALRHITNDKQLSMVVGVAGAGKTTVLEGAKQALEVEGYRVRGAAPSGIASAGLKEIGLNASTLHSLEYRIELAQKMMEENAGKPLSPKQHDFIQSAMLNEKDVLIVDEAGMVSAKQMANVIELCRQSGAKLVLVGDPAQLQSIEAGAAFRNLLERNDSVSLTEVRRQKTGWQRDATLDLSQGHVAQALKAYDEHDCIGFANSRKEAKANLVADMMASYELEPDKSRLVLAYTRKDVADLNAMIKAEMTEKGMISKESVETLVSVQDEDGMHQEKQHFAVGDRILFRENNRDLGVMNGSFGTLHDIDGKRFQVKLDTGKTVSFSTDEYNRFQLGYAATVHKSQGLTVDNTYILGTPHFDRHTSYVALSRHKENVRLYASRKDFKTKERLFGALGKRGDKLSTLGFENMQPEKIKDRKNPKQSLLQLRDQYFERAKDMFRSTRKARNHDHSHGPER